MGEVDEDLDGREQSLHQELPSGHATNRSVLGLGLTGGVKRDIHVTHSVEAHQFLWEDPTLVQK